MATVTVRFYAGAARAAGADQAQLDADTVEDLRRQFAARPDLARVCEVAVFLVDGNPASETTTLRDGAEVHVLPPFAGG